MEDTKQYIVFKTADEKYAVDINEISEIHRLNQIALTPFPKAEKYIEGIMNLRGEVVPVVNLKVILGLENLKFDKNARVLIVKKGKKNIGFIVDEIYEVKEISKEDIVDSPEEIRLNYEYIKSLISEEHYVVGIIDILEILNLNEEVR